MYQVQSTGAAPARIQTTGELFALLNDLHTFGLSHDGLTVLPNGMTPVEILHEGVHRGIRVAGQPLPALLAMLDEIDAFVLKDGKEARRPWEMLRLQWLAVVSIGSLTYSIFPAFDTYCNALWVRAAPGAKPS